MKFEKNENFLEKNRNLIQIIQINPPQRKKKTYSENLLGKSLTDSGNPHENK
jgi:hypothetical protein